MRRQSIWASRDTSKCSQYFCIIFHCLSWTLCGFFRFYLTEHTVWPLFWRYSSTDVGTTAGKSIRLTFILFNNDNKDHHTVTSPPTFRESVYIEYGPMLFGLIYVDIIVAIWVQCRKHESYIFHLCKMYVNSNVWTVLSTIKESWFWRYYFIDCVIIVIPTRKSC